MLFVGMGLVVVGAVLYLLFLKVLVARSEKQAAELDRDMKETLSRVAAPALAELSRTVEASRQPLEEASQSLARTVARLEGLARDTEMRAVVREEISRAMGMPTPTYSAMGLPTGPGPDILSDAEPQIQTVEWESPRADQGSRQDALNPELIKSLGLRCVGGDRIVVPTAHPTEPADSE